VTAEIDAITWVYAIVGSGIISGIVNSIIQVFVQRFVARPLDKRLEEYTKAVKEAIKNMNEKEKRDFAEIEKQILKIKGE
jgi:hypothetical protein